jgi:hypothetical protein
MITSDGGLLPHGELNDDLGSLTKKPLLVAVVVLTAAWIVYRHVSDHRPGPLTWQLMTGWSTGLLAYLITKYHEAHPSPHRRTDGQPGSSPGRR